MDDPWVSLAREQIAMFLAESEPERAIELLANSNQATGGLDPALQEVLRVWTGKAPGDAVVWASKLPAGESRNAGIRSVVSQWFQMDPAASTSWLASHSDSNLRQEGTRSIVESLQGFPVFIYDSMLQQADPGIRDEIKRQIEQQQQAPPDEVLPES